MSPAVRQGGAVRAKTHQRPPQADYGPVRQCDSLVCPPVVEGGLEVNAGSVVVVRCLRCEHQGVWSQNDLDAATR